MTDTLARMRQLAGTTAQWAANDLVIGDGEFAVERTSAGIKLKIGDGASRFSLLGYAPLSNDVHAVDFMTPAELTDFRTGAPTLDHTAAINRATQATLLATTNANMPMRRIILAGGNWNIAGPVYVRKGQHLQGAGMGATRITQSPAATTSVFKMGHGLVGGADTVDPGGLPPQISQLHIASSSATAAAIDTGGTPGFRLSNLFLTNVGVGIAVTGADGIIDACFFDQGLIGLAMGASQNVVVSNCLFYLLNYQMQIGDGVCDLQVNDCHFEYMQYSGIHFYDGATVKNVSVSSCQFVSNAQYGTFLGHVYTRGASVQATFSDCSFRNMWGFAFGHGTGIGNDFTFTDCVFDGSKTVAAYTQSTNAGGISTLNETVRAIDCQFRNLPQGAVVSAGTFAGLVEVVGGSYAAISTATAVVLSNSSAAHQVSLRSVRGDGVTPLVNAQGVHPVQLKNNVAWMGAAATASSRIYYRIPYTSDPLLATVTVQASTNVAANPLYRKSARYLVTKSTDYTSVVVDQAAKFLQSQDAAGFAPVIDLQVDLGTVGGGATVARSAVGGYLVLSVPVAYQNVVLRADFD
jgi:hypothetical protein